MTNKEIMYKELAEHFSEENTKLKSEIEDLKNQILCKDMTIEELEAEKNAYFTDLCKEREFSKADIEQLKETNAKLCEEIAELKGEQ